MYINIDIYTYLCCVLLCWCLSQYVNRGDGNDRNDDNDFVEIFIIIL